MVRFFLLLACSVFVIYDLCVIWFGQGIGLMAHSAKRELFAVLVVSLLAHISLQLENKR